MTADGAPMHRGATHMGDRVWVLFMGYYLGIDGGGTRTTAWLADERGRVLSRAEAGPSNPLKVGFDAAQRELLRAARSARRPAVSVESRIRRQGLEAVCAGLAGADRPQVHRRVLARMRRTIPARHHLLTTDAAITLRAALGALPGLVVISGSGSIAYGQDARGKIWRAGGWGIPFDDVGSGYDLGRRAVAAALRDFDGRGRPTLLTRRICRNLRLSAITDVVLKPPNQQQTAALFAVVLEAAHQKDAVARRLCYEAGMALADLAEAVIRRAGWRRRKFSIVCAGGVLKSSAFIRAVFAHHVRAFAPGAKIQVLHREPVEGALDLARQWAAPT